MSHAADVDRPKVLRSHRNREVLSTSARGNHFVFLVTRSNDTPRYAAPSTHGAGTLVTLDPLALASLVTGLVMALGTSWGLFRHYWVAISFVLTIVATVVLLQHMKTISYFAQVATEGDSCRRRRAARRPAGRTSACRCRPASVAHDRGAQRLQAAGLTARGRRRTSPAALEHSADDTRSAPARVAGTGTPRWVQIVGIHAAGLALVFVIMLLATGGLQRH